MRNAKLLQILESQAWERGHSAGQDEVDNILNGLIYDFKEIDDMLPYTMPPKFKVGDKLRFMESFNCEVLGIDISNRNVPPTYRIHVPEWGNGENHAMEKDLTPVLNVVSYTDTI